MGSQRASLSAAPATFLGVATTLLVIAAMTASAVGCASPSYDAPPSVESQLEPWTPRRKGIHPGDLENTPEARARPFERAHRNTSSPHRSPVTTTAFFYWRLYSSTVSRTMGETCQFSPSCSRFAVDATREGPEGLILIFARLQRNHLDDGSYESTPTGHLKDRTSNYFFWRSDLGLNAHRSTMPRQQAWYVFVKAAHDRQEQPSNE